MTPQNPNVRASHTCPRCNGEKKEGLVLCWPCNHLEKARYDGMYCKGTEAKIAAAEARLARVPEGWVVHEGGVA